MNKFFYRLLFVITLLQPIVASSNIRWRDGLINVDRIINYGLNENSLTFLQGCMPPDVKKRGITLLMLFISGNKIGHVHKLIQLTDKHNKQIIDINEQSKKGTTALHTSVNTNNPTITKILLLDDNIDVDIADKDNITPLHLGAQNGYTRVFKMVLGKTNKINPTNIDGDTPLTLASVNNCFGIVKLLLQKKYHNIIEVNIKNRKGFAALHLAYQTEKPYFKIIRALLKVPSINPNIEETKCGYGLLVKLIINHENQLALEFVRHPNIKINYRNGYYLETALMYTGKSGNVKVAGAIIAHKNTDINQINRQGNTALIYASFWKQIGVLNLLVAQNNINSLIRNNNGKTAFDIAKEKGYQAICDALANAYYKRVFDFFEALYQDDIEKIKVLSQSPDLNVNAINPYNGATLLMLGCYLRDTKVVKILLTRYSANPNISDLKYNTAPLMVASDKKCYRITKALLQHGANINQQDTQGNTALLMSIFSGRIKLIKLLLGWNKINIYLANQENITPITMASEKGLTIIVSILLAKSDAVHLNHPLQAYNALILGSYYGHSSTVQVLLNCNKIDWYTQGKKHYAYAFLMAQKNKRDKVIQVFRNDLQKKNHSVPKPKHGNKSIALLDDMLYTLNKATLSNCILK